MKKLAALIESETEESKLMRLKMLLNVKHSLRIKL